MNGFRDIGSYGNRREISGPECSGHTASKSGGGLVRRNETSHGGSRFWCFSASHLQLDRTFRIRRRSGFGSAQAWPEGRREQTKGLAGGGDLQRNPRPPSGTNKTSVRSLDERGDSYVNCPPVWRSSFGALSSTLLGPLGFHPSEADAHGVRARSESGRAVAQERIPFNPNCRETAQDTDLLGRCDGCPIRPPIGKIVCAEGANTDSHGDGKTFRHKHVFSDHQPWRFGIHDFQTTLHDGRFSLFSSSLDKTFQAYSIFDCGWASGSQEPSGATVVEGKRETDSDLFSPALQSRSQSGRDAESGCESKRRRKAAGEKSEGIDEQSQELPEPTAHSTQSRQAVLP